MFSFLCSSSSYVNYTRSWPLFGTHVNFASFEFKLNFVTWTIHNSGNFVFNRGKGLFRTEEKHFARPNEQKTHSSSTCTGFYFLIYLLPCIFFRLLVFWVLCFFRSYIWNQWFGHFLQLINEKKQVIQEYESEKAVPNQQVINKLERALGAKLRQKW